MLKKEAVVGELVIYTSKRGTREYGWITSFNEDFVFVRYVGELHSKATSYKELVYAEN